MPSPPKVGLHERGEWLFEHLLPPASNFVRVQTVLHAAETLVLQVLKCDAGVSVRREHMISLQERLAAFLEPNIVLKLQHNHMSKTSFLIVEDVEGRLQRTCTEIHHRQCR